jgi:branched-chain amino acid transport system ATP-binding protein
MQALNIISAEHRGMWRLTTAIDAIGAQMQESGSRREIGVLTLILDYLSSYIDRLHHPKEDQHLFRLLRLRSPQAAADIDLLQHEHLEGPRHLERLRALAAELAQGVEVNREEFFVALGQFGANLRAHIRSEETSVMPLARKTLTAGDWREIDAAFLDNDDPLFGANARAEFDELRARIVALAPDPVGLGGSGALPAARPAAAAERPAPSGAILLEVKGLTSHYGRIQALHGIDLTVGQGQLVALVGANGAGKTTLLRTLSGVQPASAGSIHLRGTAITGASPDRRVRAGMCQVPEGRQVFSPMTIEDNLRMGGFTRPRGEAEADLEKMYGLFPILRDKRKLLAGTLSGGQQQMLAMARGLMGRPELLLLDEPSMGLAPLLIAEIFRIVKSLRDQGITILLVEQNAHAALSIADVGYVIESGAITLSGPGPELLNNKTVQSAYLGM